MLTNVESAVIVVGDGVVICPPFLALGAQASIDDELVGPTTFSISLQTFTEVGAEWFYLVTCTTITRQYGGRAISTGDTSGHRIVLLDWAAQNTHAPYAQVLVQEECGRSYNQFQCSITRTQTFSNTCGSTKNWTVKLNGANEALR